MSPLERSQALAVRSSNVSPLDRAQALAVQSSNMSPLDRAQALAAQTVRGAATLVQRTGRHPGQLKDEVCSAGGTSIAGMHALEQGGVRASFMNAVEAATLKASQLQN